MAESSGDAPMDLAGVPGAACRINELPSDVLLRALSHLDALQVVQTSVLSRRWRDLWRSVPRIKATFDEFEGMADTEEECDMLFKVFVNRFLMLRNPVALDEFHLDYHIAYSSPDDYANSEDGNLWIHHALRCNARSVKVYGSGSEKELMLEPAVFASNCFLTRLLLHFVHLDCGFFRGLQGCTVLERLTLKICTIYDPEISSQTLKFLTIDAYCYSTYEGHASISIPSLICLEYSASGRVPSLNNMESLVTASVSVGTDDTKVDHIHQFLRSLSGVTDLEFNYRETALMMEQNVQWCPKFNNLTTLTLGRQFLHTNLDALIVFLQNSPNLVKLTLKLKQKFENREETFTGKLEDRSFTAEHLQTVCLDGSKNDPMVNILEKFFVDNGMTSDQIDIKN